MNRSSTKRLTTENRSQKSLPTMHTVEAKKSKTKKIKYRGISL
jgi:hypothetical protein